MEPLSLAHERDLTEAVRDGELWRLWYTNVPPPEAMGAEIARRCKLRDQGGMIPFAVVDVRTGAAVGMTTYMNIDTVNRHVEIGSTWYRASAQRTPINTECKLLLLTHAFETMACIAVEFRTSSFNLPSRRAIERVGAHLDGVLRSHQLHANGTLRDTYAYSIIAYEWLAARENLRHRLNEDRNARVSR
ncbi:MAG: GNAT family N-acetyltransferase [Candidatus Eremiobacteraeota bacterium]|nr:GNAT family N-acetyltransferase [Candidatus Eremiobacteraeota bacterium]